MHTINNPAGRLATILRKAKKYPKQNDVAKNVWPKILEVDPADMPQLLSRLGKLMELLEIISDEIKLQQDINHDIYLKWVPKVQAGFSVINLNGGFSAFTNPIDEAALDGLDFCSDLLSRRIPEKVLDKDKLQNIYKDTEELVKEIIASGTEKDLKTFMVNKLNEIIKAIQEYQINGSSPIEKAIESTFGALATKEGLYEGTKKTSKGDKFWNIMARVALVSGIALTSVQIGESVVNLLPDTSQEVIEAEIVEEVATNKEESS